MSDNNPLKFDPPKHFSSQLPPPPVPNAIPAAAPARPLKHTFSVSFTDPNTGAASQETMTCRAPTVRDDLTISGRKQALCIQHGISVDSADAWYCTLLATLDVLIDNPRPAWIDDPYSLLTNKPLEDAFLEVNAHMKTFRQPDNAAGAGKKAP